MKRLLTVLVALTMSIALGSAISFAPFSAQKNDTNLYQPTVLQNAAVYAQMGDITTKPQQVIAVHNAKEFFKALKPNVTIKLLPGDYDMGKVRRTKYAFYNTKYFGYYSVKGATIKNLKNVRVYADTNVLMYSSQESNGIMYDDVLTLINCSNVTFENITFGHISKTKDTTLSCLAGVLALYKCKNITIKNCDLFGCGYTGFNMEKCSNIAVADSKIHDCKTSAFWINGCNGISFENTEFYNNGIDNTWCKFGDIVDSVGTSFTLCNIHDNGAAAEQSGIMFTTYGTAELPTFDRCILTNNKY